MTETLLKPKLDLSSIFVACIFENGEDDDLPGFAAAVEDRDVMFRGKVYKKGETIEISDTHLFLSCNDVEINGESLSLLVTGPAPEGLEYFSYEPIARLHRPEDCRRIIIGRVQFHMNFKVFP
ncbi:hypothetical protein GOC16_08535 [Sinorhizobium meliloti]|nr:hypothetical protein [Sinorhizobium meliloti]